MSEVYIQNETEIENQTEAEMEEPTLKPYRSAEYDEHDTKYASLLLEPFLALNINLQNEFNEFTENLMQDEQINRYSLLRAIDDFKRNKINNTNSKFINYEWVIFTDLAYNCRPYQICSIM